MLFNDLIAIFTHYATITALINLLLLLLAVAPVAICLKNSRKKIAFSPRIILVCACVFTIALLMIFGSPGLPQKNPFLWYSLWGILLFAHWNSWIFAIAKGENPATKILPLVLPCLLLCAIGFGERNWILAIGMAFYSVAIILKKGLEVAQWN